MSNTLPSWAQQICDLFKSGSVSQFILHGNIFDTVSIASNEKNTEQSLKEYLVM